MSTTHDTGFATGLFSDRLDSATPQKLALLKRSVVNEADAQEILSEPATPSGGRQRHAFRSRASGGAGTALSRSTRQVSTMSSRRTASFMQDHRHKMSVELTAQAEKRFLALMELMASASKEASSLKEYWTRLMVDREAEGREKEQLLLQIDEISQTLEQKENQQDQHKREVSHRHKEAEKLFVELSSALDAVTEHKKKVADREAELERSQREVSESRLSLSRAQVEHEQLRSNFETTQAKLVVTEGDLTQARDETEKLRSDFRSLTREHSELKSRNTDLTTSLEATRKEIVTLTERIRNWELEKSELLFEKDKMETHSRKQTAKTDELQRELSDLTERNDRLHREHNRSKELVTKIELERDEHLGAAERFRHEIKETVLRLEESEAQRADVLLKLEQSKRHLAGAEERLIEKDSEIGVLQQRLDGKQEAYRLIVVEVDQARNDVENERKATHNARHKISSLEGLLAQAESKLTELRAETYSVTERIKIVENERDEARDKHGGLVSEIETLNAKIVLIQGEIRNANEARDQKHRELDNYKQKYEEVTETIEEWNNDSGELELEIESLRVMLREAREQKEKAIAARNTADRERDEHITLYEEKCRELERLEESSSRAAYFHSSGHGSAGRQSSSFRVISTKTGGTSSSQFNRQDEEQTVDNGA